MSLHFEIDPSRGNISFFDTVNQTSYNFAISDVNLEDDVVRMFKRIRRKVEEDVGEAAVYFPSECPYKLRKKFVFYGLQYGFKKIQLINWRTAIFYSALFQSNYMPKDFDCILILFDTNGFLWEKQNGTIKYSGLITSDEEFSESYAIKKFGISPNVIFYNEYLSKGTYNFKELFPQSKCFTYTSIWPYKKFGVVFKTKLTENDLNINKFNVTPIFEENLILSINYVKLVHIKYDDILPLTKAFPFQMYNDNNILKVDISNGEKEYFSLPNNKTLLLVLTIDTNSIYSIKYADITNDFGNKLENTFVPRAPLKSTCKIKIFDVYIFPKKLQITKAGINAIGIDLGTTRCCAAVNRKNGIETVALDNIGQRLLPSYVSYDEEMEKCGQIVIERLRNFAKSSVFDVKRIIGKRFDQINIDSSWPFSIKELYTIEPKTRSDIKDKRNENFLIKFMSSSGVTFKYPEEISAVLLKYIKIKAEEFQDTKLDAAVITVPASFNEAQMQATFDAAIIAGWETVYLLPEPVAAAFAYFIDRPIPNNSTLLLFDFGGGTLDVCIFKIQNNQLQIISKFGDPNIGGRDFDNILIKHFQNRLFEECNIKVTEDKKHKLMLNCQRIKENLSTMKEDFLDVQEIDPSSEENIYVTLKEFEAMSAELLNKIRDIIEIALCKVDLEQNKINRVLQVGGGCRMPLIKELLAEKFPNSEHCSGQNPEEAVAVGAAYYAYFLNQQDKYSCSVM